MSAETKMPETPELDKQRKAREEGHSEAIGEFLDWLRGEGYLLAKSHSHDDGCLCDGPWHDLKATDADPKQRHCPECGWPHRAEVCGYREGELAMAGKPINDLLADYFGIDLDKIEAERRAILDYIRGKDAPPTPPEPAP